MFNLPSKANSAGQSIFITPSRDDTESSKLLEGELLDLYGALLIVVPIAFFFKSLWF